MQQPLIVEQLGCSPILSLLLGNQERDFEQLSGNFHSPQQIYRILQEWKGLDIASRLSN